MPDGNSENESGVAVAERPADQKPSEQAETTPVVAGIIQAGELVKEGGSLTNSPLNAPSGEQFTHSQSEGPESEIDKLRQRVAKKAREMSYQIRSPEARELDKRVAGTADQMQAELDANPPKWEAAKEVLNRPLTYAQEEAAKSEGLATVRDMQATDASVDRVANKSPEDYQAHVNSLMEAKRQEQGALNDIASGKASITEVKKPASSISLENGGNQQGFIGKLLKLFKRT